ncbi:hypothetical protein ACC699_37710, partial [Rhizobium ruizarguesonis]
TGINLAFMAFRLCQQMVDHTPLVIRATRCMAAVLEREFDFLGRPDLPCKMRIDEPIGKEGWTQISARRESTSHEAQDHWISERVFEWSGVPTTHLR